MEIKLIIMHAVEQPAGVAYSSTFPLGRLQAMHQMFCHNNAVEKICMNPLNHYTCKYVCTQKCKKPVWPWVYVTTVDHAYVGMCTCETALPVQIFGVLLRFAAQHSRPGLLWTLLNEAGFCRSVKHVRLVWMSYPLLQLSQLLLVEGIQRFQLWVFLLELLSLQAKYTQRQSGRLKRHRKR